MIACADLTTCHLLDSLNIQTRVFFLRLRRLLKDRILFGLAHYYVPFRVLSHVETGDVVLLILVKVLVSE